MWHPRIAALGLSFWLGASLIITDALAQDVPGYRIRMPVGGSLGALIRPPRLAGTPPSTLHPFGKDRRARSFFP